MLARRSSTGLILVLLALLSTPLRAAPPTDAAAFTRHVLARLSASAPATKFAIREPLLIDVVFPNGEIAQASLDRVWGYCAANTEAACELAIGYWIDAIKPLPSPTGPTDRASIRVVVRTASVLAGYELQMHRPLVIAALAGDLRIACVIDTPTNLSYLGEPDLKKFGLTHDEAIALGIRNVAATLRPLPEIMRGDPADPWAHSDGDDYESGRILLHDSLAELSAAWGGRLIVAVPGTRTLLYADGRHKDALPALRKAVQDVMTHSERPISATLLLWTKTGWEVIPPTRVTIPPAPAAGSTARRSRVSECGPPGRRRGRRRRRRASPPPCAGDRATSLLRS
jgi:uncharacterized protein YtpQ (UPF0354 family)